MKPSGACFDAEWAARTVVAPVGVHTVDVFLRRHYLGKRPGVAVLAMMVLVDGFARGAVVYSLPPRETAQRYGCRVWEFARLFLDDSMPSNSESWVIGQSVRYIKANALPVDLLVTYADTKQGHTGAIYRATNWEYDGITDSGRKTPRFDYAVGAKRYGRRSHVPDGAAVVRVPRSPKHRFVMRLRATTGARHQQAANKNGRCCVNSDRPTDAAGRRQSMNRANSVYTAQTLRRQRTERQQQLRDGLLAADRYIRHNAQNVAFVDVSATAALRCLEWLDGDVTVSQVRQMLFDLTQRIDDITPEEDAAQAARINELAARLAGIQNGAV